MPPIWIFEKRQRPKGMEYANCQACNNGTRGADLAVGFLARLRPFAGDVDDPLFAEALDRLNSLEQLVPGLREEVFDNSPSSNSQIVRDGVLHDMVRIEANGPILATVLITFGAKLGMALYREHVGQALPLSGAVFVQPFLNGGLSQAQADKILTILPEASTLRNGRREVSSQFAYAFNSNERSIVFALASFHQNLHFMVLATSEPNVYAATVADRFVAKVGPGELKSQNWQTIVPGPYVLPGLPRPQAK